MTPTPPGKDVQPFDRLCMCGGNTCYGQTNLNSGCRCHREAESKPLAAEQEVPSPLAEFEKVERFDSTEVTEKELTVVRADKYDRLLNFTRGVVEERDRMLQEKGGLG